MTEVSIVAICKAVEAVCNVVCKAMDGQSPEQKKQMWDWYISDVTAWRKFWGLEK